MSTVCTVSINIDVTEGCHVRQVGSDLAVDEVIMSTGQTITPVDVGLLATIGCASVPCFAKPIIGVLSTGNELVEPWVTPRGSQIRDSNRPALLAAFKQDGYECIDLGIVPDVMGLEGRLERALRKCDVVVTSGGVSSMSLL